MKKKKVLKRAVDIAIDLLCKTECCVVGDQKHCPVEVGTLDSCDQCIKRFIMQRAWSELRTEKLRNQVKVIREQTEAARARNAEEKRQEGKN